MGYINSIKSINKAHVFIFSVVSILEGSDLLIQ